MSALISAAELAGLTLLALAVAVAIRRRPRRRPARPALRLVQPVADPAARPDPAAEDPDPAGRPALVLVEDGVPRPAALEFEESVGAGDEQHAVPQPRGVLATRDR
jgi:hypothetical protein